MRDDMVFDHHPKYNVKQKVITVVRGSLEGGLKLEYLYVIFANSTLNEY